MFGCKQHDKVDSVIWIESLRILGVLALSNTHARTPAHTHTEKERDKQDKSVFREREGKPYWIMVSHIPSFMHRRIIYKIKR